MRKFLITMMCIIMVVCFMPTMAFAETENSEAVINVNPENVQDYLDGKYGPIDGKTIILSAGTYGKLELGRATKYPGSNTDYYIGGIAEKNKKTFDEFVAIKNSGQWSASAYYVRNMSNVTIKAAEGAIVKVAGITGTSGHVYVKDNNYVKDYVLDKEYTVGSAYYLTQNWHNITIEGITFTAKSDIASSLDTTVIDGVTFRNCNFNIGNTASGNQALRYYNENNDGNVKNLTVEKCAFKNCFQGVYTQKINGIKVIYSRFDTTGHNAIAVQSGGAVNHKAVVIKGNTFANIGDRIIRFGDVAADTQITIKNNTASNSGDSDGEVMRAQSLAGGVTYDICGNNWGNGKNVANEELKDRDAVAEINGLQYTSLQDAIVAATNGQTVTLLNDVSTNDYTTINKKLTIDLGGHTFTSTDGGFDVYSNLTLKNGTINTLKWGAWVQSGAKLVVEKDVTMNATSTADDKGGIMVQDNGSEITLRGKVTAAGGVGVSGRGNKTEGGVIINIEPDASVICTNTKGAGIYFPNTAQLNIKGSVTGATGIYAKCGTTTIFEGAEVTATGNKVAYQYYGDGFYSTGDAIAVDSCNYPGGTPKLVIQGGTITATKGDAVNEYLGNGCTTAADMSITGGTFSSDVKAYISSSVNEYKKDDGKYIVAASSPANSSGKNAWVKGEDGVYTEIYVPVYVPTTPTTPSDNVTNSGSTAADNASTSADLSGSTSTSNGTTTATVDKTTADKIVDKAVENKSTEVVIDATANTTTAANSTTIAQVTIPTETLGAIAEKTEADVTIKTDVAEVKMDNAAAAAVSEQATGETVQIIAEKVAEETDKVEFELKVVCSDGKVISDFKGGNVAVTVALPKAMADKKVVCVYIDDNGHMSKMVGQKNADGTYTFNTGHFSSYAIMAEEEADAAIAAQKEAIKNIKIKLTSKQVKTKAGKKAVKITWTAAAGDKTLDGVEVFRSTERYKGYGTEPFYTSTKRGNKGSYTNTKSLKKGTKYYYRVRGYVLVDGQKVYTDYSTKAWRTVK